jgi:hypothetical protein
MLNWILEHWVDLLAIYGAVVAICSTIVKLTPSVKDDEIWAKILKILDKFSVCFTKEDIAKLASAAKKAKK